MPRARYRTPRLNVDALMLAGIVRRRAEKLADDRPTMLAAVFSLSDEDLDTLDDVVNAERRRRDREHDA